MQELTQDGVRQVKRLTIYVDETIDLDTAAVSEGDWAEKAIAQVMALWESTRKSARPARIPIRSSTKI